MKKSILVLGSSGQVGKDLSNLLSKKYNVIGLQRKKSSSNNFVIINHDLKDELRLNNRIDYVINCIVTHNFSKKKTIKDYVNSNIISAINTVNFSRKKNIKLIINLSSVSIFQNLNNKVLDESAIPNSNEFLGLTKLMGEKIFDSFDQSSINLRLPGILCEKYDYQRPWLNVLIQKIKNNKDFVIYDGDKKFNNLISTFQIYKFIEYLIDNQIHKYGAYNFSASKPVKLYDLVDVIKNHFDSKSKVTNSKINKSFTISTKKIENDFDYKIDSVFNILKNYLLNIT